MELLERDMSRLWWVPLSLLLLGAAPSRTQTYTAGQIISPAAVTENEDNVFSYLQAGVDTIRANAVTTSAILDGTIASADIANSAITTATIAANAVDGTKIQLGSDAQGDVLYYNGTDYVRLGAGTSGQFLKTNGASANPSWASTSVSSKAGTFTRDTTTASGTQAITGVGFQPTAIIFFATQDNAAGEASWGVDTSSNRNGILDNYSSTTNSYADTSVSIYDQESTTTNNYQGQITSFDSDGFTISWTKNGTPTGTLKVTYLALR